LQFQLGFICFVGDMFVSLPVLHHEVEMLIFSCAVFLLLIDFLAFPNVFFFDFF